MFGLGKMSRLILGANCRSSGDVCNGLGNENIGANKQFWAVVSGKQHLTITYFRRNH